MVREQFQGSAFGGGAAHAVEAMLEPYHPGRYPYAVNPFIPTVKPVPAAPQ